MNTLKESMLHLQGNEGMVLPLRSPSVKKSGAVFGSDYSLQVLHCVSSGRPHTPHTPRARCGWSFFVAFCTYGPKSEHNACPKSEYNA